MLFMPLPTLLVVLVLSLLFILSYLSMDCLDLQVAHWLPVLLKNEYF